MLSAPNPSPGPVEPSKRRRIEPCPLQDYQVGPWWKPFWSVYLNMAFMVGVGQITNDVVGKLCGGGRVYNAGSATKRGREQAVS